MHNNTEGWVIVYPNGEMDLTYFFFTEFRTKLDEYKEDVGIERWMATYRPECKAVRMKLVPV
jgi:hypothetical protein